jgi:hypothetical protein
LGSFLDRKRNVFFFLSLLIHPFCDSCALSKRQWHKIFFLFKVLSFFFLPRSSSSFGSIYFKWTSCHRPKKMTAQSWQDANDAKGISDTISACRPILFRVCVCTVFVLKKEKFTLFSVFAFGWDCKRIDRHPYIQYSSWKRIKLWTHEIGNTTLRHVYITQPWRERVEG